MSAIDDYREQERRRAAELRGLAAKVARLLGYTVEPPAADPYTRETVRLHGPDAALLTLTRPWNNPLRVSVHGGYPPGTTQVAYHMPSHTITVAISRGAQAVARDIQRRLLPGYLADLARTQQALRAQANATQAREKVAAHLLAAVPGLRRGEASQTRVTLVYYGHSHSDTNGSVQLSGSGDQVSISLTGPAGVLLPAFTAALGDHEPAGDNGTDDGLDEGMPAAPHQPRPPTNPPEGEPAEGEPAETEPSP
jgi:hypothetical protein